jgi:hypothetical protein
MARLFVYGILGLCIGAIVGILLSALVNAAGLGLVTTAAIVGLVSGVAVAASVNWSGVLDGPFVTGPQVDALDTYLAYRKPMFFPNWLRANVIQWLRSKQDHLP